MPDPKCSGSPTGTGNPPGKYSEGYLNETGKGGHFTEMGSYQTHMDVGRSPAQPPVVGNQPKEKSEKGLENPKGNADPIHH